MFTFLAIALGVVSLIWAFIDAVAPTRPTHNFNVVMALVGILFAILSK